MTQTNVPKHGTVAEILTRLQDVRRDLTPELSKLVTYLLENPDEIGVSSIRQLAAKADVKPNTLVRLSRAIGMESYEAFREVFRASIRLGRDTYPDRARWLQAVSERGEMGGLFAASAESRSTISKASLPRSITRRSIRRLRRLSTRIAAMFLAWGSTTASSRISPISPPWRLTACARCRRAACCL